MVRPCLVLVVAFALGACRDPRGEHSEDAGSLPARGNLMLSMEAGHIHVFRQVAVAFTVRDMDRCADHANLGTCEGLPGLDVTAFHKAAGSASEQGLEPGKLEDAGGGRYVWYRSYPDFGVNMVGLRFNKDGVEYADAFPLETSRGGGESYFCDLDADSTYDHVFQVRWNTSTGPVHANSTPVSFTLELLRSFNPPPLNVGQPFRNSMEALRAAELVGAAPSVTLMRDTGAAATEVIPLTPTYRGRGMFQVTHSFAEADLAGQPERTFWLHVQFTDDKGCVVDGADDAEEYHFPVER
jgi:hypothetical protein